MRVAENNRLRRALIEVRPRIQSRITWLEQEPHEVDTEPRRMIRRSPELREQDELLHSVPGVGRQACLTLLENPRNLARWIASSWPRWAEAFYNRDSGHHRSQRIAWGGRYRVCACLRKRLDIKDCCFWFDFEGAARSMILGVVVERPPVVRFGAALDEMSQACFPFLGHGISCACKFRPQSWFSYTPLRRQ